MYRIIYSFLLFTSAFSTIINIPFDQPTIQAGIETSTDGDTVLVQPGTYYEHINFACHQITLGSMFIMTGDTSYISQTIIDGNSTERVVTFNCGESLESILTGFTIQNGATQSVSDPYRNGAGIGCFGSSPSLMNLIVKDNEAFGGNIGGQGGGIYLSNSHSGLSNIVIKDNSATSIGGISIIDFSAVTMNNVIVESNSGLQEAGGIYVFWSDLFMQNNRFPRASPGSLRLQLHSELT